MKQEQKELLLKDLSAKLPYEIKGLINGFVGIIYPHDIEDLQKDLRIIKPYLFPISNMTEEQKEKYHNLCSIGIDECGDIIYFDTYESIDYLNKNKFDYRYLIPMGLAIDATNLNIY